MSFFDALRRIVVVLEAPRDVEATLLATERVTGAIEAAHFVVVEPEGGLDDASASALDEAVGRFRPRLSGARPPITFVPALDAASIGVLAEEERADLVVVGPLESASPRERAALLVRLASKLARHALSVGAAFEARSAPRTIGRIALVLDAAGASLDAMAPLLLRLDEGLEVVAMSPGADEARCLALEASLSALMPGRAAKVAAVSAPTIVAAEEVDRRARRAASDLVVSAADAVSDLEALAFGLFSAGDLQRAACPTLLLARTKPTSLLPADRLSASDTLCLARGDCPIALERIGPFGQSPVAPGEPLAVTLHDAEIAARGRDDGVLVVSRGALADGPSIAALWVSATREPSSHASARVLRPTMPIVLVDAAVKSPDHPMIVRAAADRHVVFARMRRRDPMSSLRERLLAASPGAEPPIVIDASAFLDDEGADDVPRFVDPLRSMRLALGLVSLGATVEVVVTTERAHALASGRSVPLEEWSQPFDEEGLTASDPVDDASALGEELDRVTRSKATPGHTIELDLDNGAARRALLDAIERARERVHFQCYIVDDDPVTGEIVEALARAALRGASVRVLVDALYSGHEVLGRKNPALAALEATPGVSVRAFSPITTLPDLPALKQRNHRKCAIVDGARAWVTGRNLGATYYRAFEEVAITRASIYRELPWLDCGVRFEGPLVAAVEQGFAHDWARSGGDAFDVSVTPARGPVVLRYVLHEGLADTSAFDAYLALIRHAREELVVVNAFPLVLELARALVAAVQRGVRVRLLFGAVRPRYGEEVPFVGGAYRSLADRLVRARLDAIVAAGADVHEHAMEPLAHWEPELGRVFPYVHAKVLVRDRRDVAVGSANLDVTAAYWESEAMVVAHDASFARSVVHALEPVLASSPRLDARSPRFQAESTQRAWFSRHWPALIG